MTAKPSKAQIRQALINHMAELLQVPSDQLDPSSSFLEQGADSIVLVEAVRRIESAYGVRISMQQFFEELPSIEALSEYLAEHAQQPEAKPAQAAEPTPAPAPAAAPAPAPVAAQPPAPVAAITPPAAPPTRDNRALSSQITNTTMPNGTVGLMQAQIQLIKHTIEQQNRVLAAQSSLGNQQQPAAARTAIQSPAPSPAPSSAAPAKLPASTAIADTKTDNTAPLAAKQMHDIATSSQASIDFGLYFFGTYDAPYTQDKYDLLFEAVKYGDNNNFSSAWLPERHFHSFGGLSPNPAVLCSALASTTSNIQLRAGSVVAPLHNPVRLTEEWSLVDNLSKGRVGLAFACGWHSNDFIFAPEKYENRQAEMDQSLDQVRRMWRGEQISFAAGNNTEYAPTIFQQPCQQELPVWLTIVNNIEMYRRAGRDGYGVLTNLMGQSPEVFAENLAAYREAWREAGHPGQGYVSLLVHTFVMDDAQAAIEMAREPFINYLKSAVGLFKTLVGGLGKEVDFDHLTEADRDYLLNVAYQNYVETRALIGSPESTSAVVEKLIALGVEEIGCFVDFGVDHKVVVQNLPALNDLRQRFANDSAARAQA